MDLNLFDPTTDENQYRFRQSVCRSMCPCPVQEIISTHSHNDVLNIADMSTKAIIATDFAEFYRRESVFYGRSHFFNALEMNRRKEKKNVHLEGHKNVFRR